MPIRLMSFALCALAASATLAPLAARAADAASGAGNRTYARDRADCNAGKTAEDRATCLKEAGAAQEERKRHRLDTNGPTGANATDRCSALAGKDKADCMARIDGPSRANQTVTTSGSVAGGGILRETRTVTPGAVVVVPAPAASAASR